jgi:hypothetical protein
LRMRASVVLTITVLLAVAIAGVPRAAAQHPSEIPEAQSAEMAKAILKQAIEGLGGAVYLGVRDSDCTGRLSQFGELTGEFGGYIEFHDMRILPNKLRREFTKKAPIIDVYSGDTGWTLDKGGVEDADAVAVAGFQASLKIGMDYLLRYRLNEPGLYFHYGGLDVVDLKQADWAEITDSEARNYRLAVDRNTHLPVQFVVTTQNPETRLEIKDTTFYSNWHVQDGVQTPFQVSRIRDGKRVFQSFYYGCKYNSGVSPELFTRESLQQHWKQSGHKSK